MSLLDLAIEFAAKAHAKQKRKGTNIPYISHPYGVGMILLEAKCKKEVVIAGLLHDTLEDTDTTEEEIENTFGLEVLNLVKGASEPDKGASWEERKQHTIEYLKDAPQAVRELACADKLHNLRSIKRDIAHLGEDAWDRFNRGKAQQKWYYKEIVKSLEYQDSFPLVDLLKAEVQTIFEGKI